MISTVRDLTGYMSIITITVKHMLGWFMSYYCYCCVPVLYEIGMTGVVVVALAHHSPCWSEFPTLQFYTLLLPEWCRTWLPTKNICKSASLLRVTGQTLQYWHWQTFFIYHQSLPPGAGAHLPHIAFVFGLPNQQVESMLALAFYIAKRRERALTGAGNAFLCWAIKVTSWVPHKITFSTFSLFLTGK